MRRLQGRRAVVCEREGAKRVNWKGENGESRRDRGDVSGGDSRLRRGTDRVERLRGRLLIGQSSKKGAGQ